MEGKGVRKERQERDTCVLHHKGASGDELVRSDAPAPVASVEGPQPRNRQQVERPASITDLRPKKHPEFSPSSLVPVDCFSWNMHEPTLVPMPG